MPNVRKRITEALPLPLLMLVISTLISSSKLNMSLLCPHSWVARDARPEFPAKEVVN